MLDRVTGKRRVVSATAKKETPGGRKEARERLFQKLAAAQTFHEKMRFSELVSLFVEDQRATVKDSTRRRNENTLGRLVKILDDPYVDKLTSGYVRQRLLALGREPETVNEYLRRFRSFWRWAYRNNYVESSAVADRLENLKVPPHRLRIQDKYLEADEAEKVVQLLPEDWSLVCRFMLLSGLRFGEVSALDREDVSDVIEVYKTRDAITGVISETKTQGSTRQVHVTAQLKDLLGKIDRYMRRRRELTGSDCPALFLNDAGERINLAAFNKALKTATKAVTGRELTSHALRHSFASFLMAHDTDLDVIQRVLGHTHSDVTKRIYLHVTEELKKKDAAALEAAFSGQNSGQSGQEKRSASN